jgi:hypothetical protein
LDERTAFEILREKGIDLKRRKVSEKLKKMVFFLDDAQKKYGERNFWEILIKTTGEWMPKNFRFVISATHSLSGGKESPVEFGSLPRLSRNAFLLTDEEAYQLLDFRNLEGCSCQRMWRSCWSFALVYRFSCEGILLLQE